MKVDSIFLSINNLKSSVPAGVFEAERLIWSQYYNSLFNGSVYSSQLSSRLDVYYKDSGRILIVNTNLACFDQNEFDSLTNLDAISRIGVNTNDYRYIVITDCIGAIQSHYKIDPNDISLLDSLHRPKNHSISPTNYSSMSPMGKFSRSPIKLQSDNLGYRLLVDQEAKLFDSQVEKSVVFLGGSFAHSIFSPPGYSLIEQCQNEFSNLTNTSCYRFFNLSQGGLQQGDNFSQLISLGIHTHVKYIVWLDGLNDIVWGLSPNMLYGTDLPFLFDVGRCETFESFEYVQSPDAFLARIRAFIADRKNINSLLASFGIKCINILQPIHELSHECASARAIEFVDEFSSAGTFYYDMFRPCLDIVPAIASSEFGVEFYANKQESTYYEFFDYVHMSPRGEKSFAKDVARYLSKIIDV